MQRFLIPCLTAAFVLGCSESTLVPAGPPPGDLSGPNLASSTTLTSSSDHELAFVEYIPCANGGAGEWISIGGTVHEVLHVTITAQGRATLVTHVQPQGVSGTGLVTGDKYNGVGVLHDTQTFGVGVEQSTVHNFLLIGQGSGNNLTVHENVRTTVNADGTVSELHDNFRVSCK